MCVGGGWVVIEIVWIVVLEIEKMVPGGHCGVVSVREVGSCSGIPLGRL